MGHGNVGSFPVQGNDVYYEDLIKEMLKFANNQTKSVEIFDKELKWNIKLYIDVCHSGSCITEAQEWC